ncbi:MAG: GNAT family N-acetyltransferase [Erysipelotrichales bacterium]|nr:GNAT family N-acetyltransferase [Erysipelotrichales bacterium]
MNIRKAHLEDAKHLNDLLTLLIQDEKQYDDSINENFIVKDFYEHYVEDKNRCILVALDENKIVGYLYGYIKSVDPTINNKTSVLDALYVDNSFRDKGIANELIENFKHWSKENKVNSIEVSVCSNNIKAKNLYNKHGFQTIKETLILEIDNN